MSFDPAAAGWVPAPQAGFVGLVGPFWTRLQDGTPRYAFQIAARHLNELGVAHGGSLFAFLDTVLGWQAMAEAGGGPAATAQLDSHFIASAREGDFVEARSRVMRRTRSLVFLQGSLLVGPEEIFAATGVWKILAGRPHRGLA